MLRVGRGGRRPRLRRAYCLALNWEGRDFVIQNYLSGKQVVSRPVLAEILHGMTRWTQRATVERRLRTVPPEMDLLSCLIDSDIILEEGSAIETRDRAVERTWAWGHNARFFHFSTQEVDYTFDHEQVRAHFERKARAHPPPSPFKQVPGKRIALAASFSDLNGGLWSALAERRTVRDFAARPISFAEFSTVLLWTWGMTRYYNASRLDRRVLKTSPSGGARHPIEVYAVVQQVEGLASGIYHYSVEHSSLVRIRAGRFADRMVELFSGQAWIRNAAALFILTAVLPRSMWKYDHSRAYRVIHLDAGHLGQTLHLVTTALGLGVFSTAALKDREIEDLLHVDGVTETVIYAGAIGHKSSSALVGAGGRRRDVRSTGRAVIHDRA